MGDPEEVELTPEGIEVAEALVDEGFTPEEAVEIIVENAEEDDPEPELDIEQNFVPLEPTFETGDVGDD